MEKWVKTEIKRKVISMRDRKIKIEYGDYPFGHVDSDFPDKIFLPTWYKKLSKRDLELIIEHEKSHLKDLKKYGSFFGIIITLLIRDIIPYPRSWEYLKVTFKITPPGQYLKSIVTDFFSPVYKIRGKYEVNPYFFTLWGMILIGGFIYGS